MSHQSNISAQEALGKLQKGNQAYLTASAQGISPPKSARTPARTASIPTRL